MTTDLTVRFCPQCYSENLSEDESYLAKSTALPAYYVCNDCDNAGQFFPKAKRSKIKQYKKNPKKVKHDRKKQPQLADTAYGNFEVKFYWKVVSPIFILLGFFIIFQDLLIGTLLILVGLILGYFTFIKN